MYRKSYTRLWPLFLGVSLLSGCSFFGANQDGAPLYPRDVSRIPDAVPRREPLCRTCNPYSYTVLGKTYHVLPTISGYQRQGLASWYGTKFHGNETASGEVYDMYKMTAAHKTLPIPSYAKVTNVNNGKSVIVKINDRGPFHGDRLIDLSYAAASKLGILANGTGYVKVEAIDPDQWSRTQIAGR